MSKEILNAYEARRKEETREKKGAQEGIEYKPDDDKTAKNNEVDSVSVGEFENGAPMEIEEHNKVIIVLEEDCDVHAEEKSDGTVESEEEEEMFELGSDTDVDDNEQPEHVMPEIAEVCKLKV